MTQPVLNTGQSSAGQSLAADPQHSAVVRVESLEKWFDHNHVLRGVDLRIERGTVVGLLGRNGAGKSTLLKCLLGLLKPTAGSIHVLEEDPWSLSADAKRRLGYAAQEVQLPPWLRVRQLLEYTAAFYDNWDDALVQELVRRWELPPDERVGPLSVGQQQKLSLILALGHQPDLLILDEPVASLDPSARRHFLTTILEVVAAAERTVLFSTHITSDLERVADHVAVLQDGCISTFAELDELKDSVKRIRLRAGRELPPSFSVAGAFRCDVSGREALIAVPRLSEELLEELRSEWDAQVAVEDLSLEDIFLEMHHDA